MGYDWAYEDWWLQCNWMGYAWAYEDAYITISSIRSKPSLSARRKLAFYMKLHTESGKDSDYTGRMPRLNIFFTRSTLICHVLSHLKRVHGNTAISSFVVVWCFWCVHLFCWGWIWLLFCWFHIHFLGCIMKLNYRNNTARNLDSGYM